MLSRMRTCHVGVSLRGVVHQLHGGHVVRRDVLANPDLLVVAGRHFLAHVAPQLKDAKDDGEDRRGVVELHLLPFLGAGIAREGVRMQESDVAVHVCHCDRFEIGVDLAIILLFRRCKLVCGVVEVVLLPSQLEEAVKIDGPIHHRSRGEADVMVRIE